MPLLASCALVLAHLCASPQIAPSVSLSAMYMNPDMISRYEKAHVVQKQNGIVADIFLSDFFFEVPVSKVSKACSDGLCVYYRRHCERLRCEYTWGDYAAGVQLESVILAKSLTIAARTNEELQDIQSNLSFVPASDEAKNISLGLLKVSDLKDDSPNTNVIQFLDRQRALRGGSAIVPEISKPVVVDGRAPNDR